MKIEHIFYKRHLEDGEEIFEVVHRHWLMLKMKLWKSTTFGILPPLIIFYFYPIFFIVCLVWLILGVSHFVLKYMEWFYDCLLITNLGVMDIERRGVFDNVAKRIEYNMIDGVSYSIKGFLPTLLNYGDVIIDKQGSRIRINLKDAGNPRKINRTIMKYQEKFIQEKSFSDHETLKSMLADMIAIHAKKTGVKHSDKK